MIRFLHLSDLHLGAIPAFLGDKAARRSEDFFNAFSGAVYFATNPANAIDSVIVAGDFFDSPNPSGSVIQQALEQLDKLKQANIPVVLIAGKQDAIGWPDSIYKRMSSEFQNLVHFGDQSQVEHIFSYEKNSDVIHFYGMSWDVTTSHPPFDSFEKNPDPGFHVAILYGTLNNCSVAENYSREVPLDLNNLGKTGMDYIALGQVHAYHRHTAGNIPVVYSGTLEGRLFIPGDEGTRSLVVVQLEKGQQVKIETFPWNTRTLESARIDLDKEAIDTSEQLENLVRMRYASPQKIFKLQLFGNPPFFIDAETLTNKLSDDFYWIQIDDNTVGFTGNEIEDWKREKTIRGLFVNKLQHYLAGVSSEYERQKVQTALKFAIQAFQKTGRG